MPPATPANTPGMPAAPPASPKLALTIAALDFASRVYQGTGQADDAIALANQCFAGWVGEDLS